MTTRKVDIVYAVKGANVARRAAEGVAQAEATLEKSVAAASDKITTQAQASATLSAAMKSTSQVLAVQIQQLNVYRDSASTAAKATRNFEQAGRSLGGASQQGAASATRLASGFGRVGEAAIVMNQGLGVAATAASTLRASFDALAEGARMRDLARSFEALGGSASTLQGARGALGGTVSDADIQRYFNTARALGISAERFEQITRAAKASATLLGTDVKYQLESLSLGVARQSRLLLDNAGIILDLDKHQRRLADGLGITADKLSEAQRGQAFWNAFLEETNRLIGRAPIEAHADAYGRMTAAIENSANAAKMAMSDALAPFFDEIASSFTILTASMDELESRRQELESRARGSLSNPADLLFFGLGMSNPLQTGAAFRLQEVQEAEANRELEKLEETVGLYKARLALVEAAAADPLTQAIQGNADALNAEAEALRKTLSTAEELLFNARAQRFVIEPLSPIIDSLNQSVDQNRAMLEGAAAAGDTLSQIMLTLAGHGYDFQTAVGNIAPALTAAKEAAAAFAKQWAASAKQVGFIFGMERPYKRKPSKADRRARQSRLDRASEAALARVAQDDLLIGGLEDEVMPGLTSGLSVGTSQRSVGEYFASGLSLPPAADFEEWAKSLQATLVDPTISAMTRLAESFGGATDGMGDALTRLGTIGNSAFNMMASGMGQAAASAIIHGESFSSSIKQLTGAVLESIAVQALSQSAYLAAIGIAMSAGIPIPGLGFFGAAGASAAFASAAALAGVGATAAVAARAFGGGGGAAGQGAARSGAFDTPGPSSGLRAATQGEPTQVVINNSFAGRPFTTEREMSRAFERIGVQARGFRGGSTSTRGRL